MKNLTLSICLLFFTLAACAPKQEKIEKNVTIEMNVQGDSTAEATVTITTDSAGNEVQRVEVIKGNPETVKTTVEKYKN